MCDRPFHGSLGRSETRSPAVLLESPLIQPMHSGRTQGRAMNHTHDNGRDPTAVNPLIAQIIVDADSEDNKLRAFHRAFLEAFQLPCDAFIIGEPVSIIAFEYHGQPRRGLTARCRREDGSEHTIAAVDIVLTERATEIQLLAAYRHWLGLDDRPTETTGPKRPGRRHKASTTDIDTSRPVELAVLSLKDTTARCRLLDSDRQITLRASGLWQTVPGEILVVKPSKLWTYAGNPYLSGEIDSVRLDVGALGLVPLQLTPRGLWDPAEHYWGEEDEPLESWAAANYRSRTPRGIQDGAGVAGRGPAGFRLGPHPTIQRVAGSRPQCRSVAGPHEVLSGRSPLPGRSCPPWTIDV